MNVAKLLAKAKENKDALKNREATIKPKQGTNRYVLLPDWNKERSEEFYVAFSQHFIKDFSKMTDGKPECTIHVCAAHTFGTDCAICDAVAEAGRYLGRDASDDQLEELKEMKAGTVYLLNVLEVDESGNHDGKPKILQISKTTLNAILDMMDEWGEAIFVDHQVININRDGVGLGTKYTVNVGARKLHVAPEILNRLTDLDDYVKQNNEEKKRIAINVVKRTVGIPTSVDHSVIPAERTIGTTASSSATEIEYRDIAPADITEVNLDDELDGLLDDVANG